jgi:hypothetical protein
MGRYTNGGEDLHWGMDMSFRDGTPMANVAAPRITLPANFTP